MGHVKKIFALSLILAATTVAAQSVPPVINYQGRLMDGGGMPVTGAVPAAFALWGDPTGAPCPTVSAR
jgi:hypothetical protein